MKIPLHVENMTVVSAVKENHFKCVKSEAIVPSCCIEPEIMFHLKETVFQIKCHPVAVWNVQVCSGNQGI